MQGLVDMNPEVDFRLWTRNNIQELGFNPNKLRFQNPVWNSDIIRLEAVRQMGGIYLDCDMEPLKPIDSLFNRSAFSVRQGDGLINNAVFGAIPDHPYITWQLDRVEEYIPKRREWAVYLMTDACLAHEWLVDLVDPNLVYPFWHDTPDEHRRSHADSLLVHHWQKTWMSL